MNIKKYVDLAIGIALIIYLLSLVLAAMPIDFPYFFNFDESIELIRVHLLQRNYVFYKEVWSDHPLGFARYFQFFANFIEITLPSARRLVLFLSAINLFVFYHLLRIHCDRFSATIAALILITSYRYVLLSASVINELPAITFVTISFLLMYWYANNLKKFRYFYLLVCAFIFIFSLEVKLSGLTALPTLVAIGVSQSNRWTNKVKDAIIWMGASGATFAIFSATILPFSYYHFIGSHRAASARIAAENIDTNMTLSMLIEGGLKNDTIYVVLAILACVAFLWSRNKSQLYPPLLWLGFNLLRFYTTRPVWANYYIYLATPSVWLIGLMLTRFDWNSVWRNIQEKRFSFLKMVLPISIIIAILGQLTFNTFKIVTARQPKRYRHPMLAFYNSKVKEYQPNPVEVFLNPYKGSHKILLTDNPYFIHKFELDTPPETAILSQKRVETEKIDGNFILEIIQKRKPDFVLLDRFPDRFMKSKALSDFLQENYSESLLKDSRSRFFIAKNQKPAQK